MRGGWRRSLGSTGRSLKRGPDTAHTVNLIWQRSFREHDG